MHCTVLHSRKMSGIDSMHANDKIRLFQIKACSACCTRFGNIYFNVSKTQTAISWPNQAHTSSKNCLSISVSHVSVQTMQVSSIEASHNIHRATYYCLKMCHWYAFCLKMWHWCQETWKSHLLAQAEQPKVYQAFACHSLLIKWVLCQSVKFNLCIIFGSSREKFQKYQVFFLSTEF